MTRITARFAIPLAFIALPAFAPVAHAQQDVGEFSKDDAEAVLSDENCPVKLPNGQCARESDERGFSFQNVGKGKPAPASANLQRPSPVSPAARPGSRNVVTPSSGKIKTVGKTPGTITRAPAPARELPLQFALGSSELSAQSKVNLGNMATALKTPANLTKKIRITGHTDKSGSLEVNRALSQKRADAAADFIASLGVDRSRIEAVGMGFDNLLPGQSAFSPRNRRVEVERVE